MTAFQWIALIGAAAWLPQIGRWLYAYFVKPEVRLVIADHPEVGYSTFGSILNLNCAVSAFRKSALVEKITLTVRHERGQTAHLTWKTLNESLSQAISTTGETAEYIKRQAAIALKVDTASLVERQIGFQDLEFLAEFRQLSNVAIDIQSHFKRTNNNEYRQLTLASPEFANLQMFFRERFFWQVGRYDVTAHITVFGNSEQTEAHFSFDLSDDDVTRLQANLGEIERMLREAVQPSPSPVKEVWNWAYPEIVQITK